MNINLLEKKSTIKSNHWKGFRFLNLLLFVYTFLNNEAFQVLKRTNHSNNKIFQTILLFKKITNFRCCNIYLWFSFGIYMGPLIEVLLASLSFLVHFHFHGYEPLMKSSTTSTAKIPIKREKIMYKSLT